MATKRQAERGAARLARKYGMEVEGLAHEPEDSFPKKWAFWLVTYNEHGDCTQRLTAYIHENGDIEGAY